MSTLNTISGNISNFFAWWAEEMKGLFPSTWSRNEQDLEEHICILLTDEGQEIYHVKPDGKSLLATCANSPEALKDAMAELPIAAKKTRTLPVRCEVRPPTYISWDKTRPSQALRRLTNLARIDLQTSTPLNPDEAVIAVDILEKTERTIQAREFAIKRTRLQAIEDMFLEAGVQLDQLGPERTHIDFLSHIDPPQSNLVTRLGRRSALAILSVALVLGGYWLRQENILNTLTDETTRRQARATEARVQQGNLEQRYAALEWLSTERANYASVIESWEILSDALPEQAWLTEFSLSNREIRIVGFASQAAPLVNTLQNSPALGSVRLTAPISLDSRRGLERFSMEMTREAETASDRTQAQ